MKTLLIGQAPSLESQGHRPFTGRCGKFLAERLMGLTQEQMLATFDFQNVLNTYPGRSPLGGDLFPMALAQPSARAMTSTFVGRSRIVLLGHGVAKAFKVKSFTYFSPYRLDGTFNGQALLVPSVFVAPHPSGVNRWYNDPNNLALAKKFFSWLVETEIKEK